MIFVFADTGGNTIQKRFWTITLFIFAFPPFGHFSAVSSDRQAVLERSQIHKKHYDRRHSAGNSLTNVDSVQFQPGDFAGDYDMALGEPVEQPVRSTGTNRRHKLTRSQKGRKADFDSYVESAKGVETDSTSALIDRVVSQNQQNLYEASNRQNDESLTLEDNKLADAPWEGTPVEPQSLVPQQQQQQFDDPPVDHVQDGLVDEVHKLEKEINKLEDERGLSYPANATVKANSTFNLKWKQYKNLTDVDTMELKYEVSGKDSLTVEIIFFILMPSFLVLCLIYLAVTLYWTKCWFWKVVPPDRFYQFERYEIEQDEDPTDFAPLLKTPLEALHEAELREHDRLESAPEEYRNADTSGDESNRNPPRKARRKTTQNQAAVADDGYGLSNYDPDGRHNRSTRTRDKSDNDSTDREERERQQRRKSKR